MPQPDDLLVLLEVARTGSFVAAGGALGLDHTTVSRRIRRLETDLGQPVVIRSAAGCTPTEVGRGLLDAAERIERALRSVQDLRDPDASADPAGLVRITAPDAFGSLIVSPALARLHRRFPGLRTELVTRTHSPIQGVGSDLEIGVGPVGSTGTGLLELAPYSLGLWATPSYLAESGTPTEIRELAGHSLVYYVDSLLRVSDLDLVRRLFPRGIADLGSTSVFAQTEATAAGGGIGLLPNFLAGRHPALRRLLHAEIDVVLAFHVAVAPAILRRPATSAVLQAIRQEALARREELLPGTTSDS